MVGTGIPGGSGSAELHVELVDGSDGTASDGVPKVGGAIGRSELPKSCRDRFVCGPAVVLHAGCTARLPHPPVACCTR